MMTAPQSLSTDDRAQAGLEDRYHYRLIGRALAEIDAAAAAGQGQLPLDELARRMGLSPAHFQRQFSAWVGISPKRYHQYLQHGLARQLLAERFSLLETASDLGLSGTGRLHDLFLTWEAMSPGEAARGGAGLELRWGRFASPFGPVLAMGSARGLCGLAFAAEQGEAAALADLQGRWPRAAFREDPGPLRAWVEAAFNQGGAGGAGGHQGAPIPLHLIGAPFQIKVWEALLRIPSGHVTTYSTLAQAIGAPKAMRAVGTAVGRNPISWLIPCHRALAKSGGLGGYHWGLGVKRAMLAYEAAHRDGPAQP